MGRTVCTQPQCLYKGALYLTFHENAPTEYVVYQRKNVVDTWGNKYVGLK